MTRERDRDRETDGGREGERIIESRREGGWDLERESDNMSSEGTPCLKKRALFCLWTGHLQN